MRRRLLLAMAALVFLAGMAPASDPVGIYGLVEKVVLEPERGKPERIQVWGVFQLAKANKGDGEYYQKPAYGYLYYRLESGKEDVCRNEWADLKEIAGTGQPIAFAGRYQQLGQVRKAAEKAEKPIPYPIADGIEKLKGTNGTAGELRSLPMPVQPADGGEVTAGAVTLRARPIADKERKRVQYVFFIADAAGHEEGSKFLVPEAEGKEVSWKPKMMVKPGEKYTWRVFAIAPDWKGPELASTFKGK